MLLIGIGMGLSAGITDGQAMSLVPPQRVGMAAGFLNTIRGVSQALVIAVFGAALISVVQTRLGSDELADRVAAGDLSGPDQSFLAEQLTGAWHVVLWSVAGTCAVAALTVFALLAPRGRAPVVAPATRPASDERA